MDGIEERKEESMKVELLSYTQDAEKIVAAAAKLCYSKSGIDEVMDGLTEERTERFIKMLMELGHESPVEHASFTFGIEGVSRALLAQITRHRLASFSVKSQRYVEEGQFEFVVPPEIEKDEEARKLFLSSMHSAQEYYNQLADKLEKTHYMALLKEGKTEKEAKKAAQKKAIEDARFVLPNACTTKMIVTMNVRSLFNFFHQRCCQRAQWEIRALANQMLALVKEKAPTLFRDAGPACVAGPCPEGKMSCGRVLEMRKLYLGEE